MGGGTDSPPSTGSSLGSPQGAPRIALRGLSLKVAGNGEWVPGSPGRDRCGQGRGLGLCGGQLAAVCMPPPAGHHRNGWHWSRTNDQLRAVDIALKPQSSDFWGVPSAFQGVHKVKNIFFFIIITIYLVKFSQIYRWKVHWPDFKYHIETNL